MTIGIDGSRAFLKDKTGTENYSYQLLKALAKIDTENIYLIYLRNLSRGPASSQPQKWLRSLPLAVTPSQIPGKWPKNFHFKVLNYPRLWTQIGLAKATFEDKLDVLFVPSHTLPLIRKPGLKTVITVHDLGSEYLPGFHQLKQLLYLKLMTHYQLKTATKIIAVSQATKKDLVKKVGINSEKISVVYEGVDNSIFKKISKDSLKDILIRYKLEEGKYFLFVGTIQPRKNLEKLIKAFNQFLNFQFSIFNFQLVLVGQKGWKSDQIYRLPEKLGIEDKVKFLGRVSEQDMVGLYNGAIALTFPSLFEGFGLPILEAFACGCPVITSNLSSMPEVAGNAGLLVNPYKEGEIAQAMLKLTKDSTLRMSLIDKGIIRTSKFSWEKAAIQTLQILKEAA